MNGNSENMMAPMFCASRRRRPIHAKLQFRSHDGTRALRIAPCATSTVNHRPRNIDWICVGTSKANRLNATHVLRTAHVYSGKTLSTRRLGSAHGKPQSKRMLCAQRKFGPCLNVFHRSVHDVSIMRNAQNNSPFVVFAARTPRIVRTAMSRQKRL